jgi:hypothetical protein
MGGVLSARTPLFSSFLQPQQLTPHHDEINALERPQRRPGYKAAGVGNDMGHQTASAIVGLESVLKSPSPGGADPAAFLRPPHQLAAGFQMS